MKSEEKRRRFHEALLQMLYPPPPKEDDDQGSVSTLSEELNFDRFPDELEGVRGSPSTSTADEGEGEGYTERDGPKKLTRAQRKRLRKKKLKEGASRRRKIIGPTLPGWEDHGEGEANDDVAEKGTLGVRQNAGDVPDIGANKPVEVPSCSKRNRQKHRRMAKKQASEKRSPTTEDQGPGLSKEGKRDQPPDSSATELDT